MSFAEMRNLEGLEAAIHHFVFPSVSDKAAWRPPQHARHLCFEACWRRCAKTTHSIMCACVGGQFLDLELLSGWITRATPLTMQPNQRITVEDKLSKTDT